MDRKRITFDLDATLLAKLDDSARQQRVSRNRFILDSVVRAVQDEERRRIDCEFAAMAEDAEYCSGLLSIDRELNAESQLSWDQIDRDGR